MDTVNYITLAVFGGCMAGVFAFVVLAMRQKTHNTPEPPLGPALPARRADLREVCRQLAQNLAGVSLSGAGALQFDHKGLRGRIEFISDKTEIQVVAPGLLHAVVEVVPLGFPMSLLRPGERNKLRARGSKPEYDRIFKNPAEEQVLLEVGTPYELRLAPDGVTMRITSLPGSAMVLGYWLSCAFRILDLIPGIEEIRQIQVSAVTHQIATDTVCQVCGASLMSAPIVRCAKCATPHHEDCWKFNGRCSTFGCGETRSR